MAMCWQMATLYPLPLASGRRFPVGASLGSSPEGTGGVSPGSVHADLAAVSFAAEQFSNEVGGFSDIG